MSTTRWTLIYCTLALVMGLILALLVLAVPVDGNGTRIWTGQLISGFWMAWTFPSAFFFWCIATLLITFTILAIKYPETPRVGVLRIETTRGDRLFITLLGSAFINLAWLGYDILRDAIIDWGNSPYLFWLVRYPARFFRTVAELLPADTGPQPWALVICVIYAAAVFRWV